MLGWPPILQSHYYEITPTKLRETVFFNFIFIVFVFCFFGFFFGELCKRVVGREKRLLMQVYMYGLLKDFILS